MKVSVITTLKNESNHLDRFIHALLQQSRKINELVICDGGSTDNTIELLNNYEKKYPFIKVVRKKGGISVGRNEAIRSAKYDVIAVTDAGTVAHKDWLKNIITPFEVDSSVAVVGGLFKVNPESFFENVSATQMLSDHDRINPETWLPSSRSIAFKKEAWKRVRGYPESLPFAGEDTVFDLSLKKAGYKIQFAPEAIVYWRPRPDLKSFFNQYVNYAYGDGVSRTHVKQYMKKIIIYILGLILLIIYWPLAIVLVVLYFIKKGRRVFLKYPRAKTALLSVTITVANDLADIFGFLKGITFKVFQSEKS